MAISWYSRVMAEREDPTLQEIGAAFGAQLLGGTIVDGPPPPDSPLGRIIALSDAHKDGLITADEMRDGIRRIQRQAQLDSGEEPV